MRGYEILCTSSHRLATLFRAPTTAHPLSAVFKHGLVPDAAYASLVRSRRRQLHGLVARALEKHFAAIVEAEPEIVAHHYTEAKPAAPAIRSWKKAGNRALELSAIPPRRGF
jgi:predicted ATPase